MLKKRTTTTATHQLVVLSTLHRCTRPSLSTCGETSNPCPLWLPLHARLADDLDTFKLTLGMEMHMPCPKSEFDQEQHPSPPPPKHKKRENLNKTRQEQNQALRSERNVLPEGFYRPVRSIRECESLRIVPRHGEAPRIRAAWPGRFTLEPTQNRGELRYGTVPSCLPRKTGSTPINPSSRFEAAPCMKKQQSQTGSRWHGPWPVPLFPKDLKLSPAVPQATLATRPSNPHWTYGFPFPAKGFQNLGGFSKMGGVEP